LISLIDPMRIAPVAILVLSLATVAGAGGNIEQGRADYSRYCASCHGEKGEGNGPLARVLTTPPANLRLLSHRFGNPLPEDQIAAYIDGRADVKAHGTRDMPVWGERFYAQSGGSDVQTRQRIANLVAFLQSIQTGAQTASR
jgi:mono/diheme cytochrome c family protein